jgi:hypothetical protein
VEDFHWLPLKKKIQNSKVEGKHYNYLKGFREASQTDSMQTTIFINLEIAECSSKFKATTCFHHP